MGAELSLRTNLIRLASTFPAGSSERRALLAALKKESADSLTEEHLEDWVEHYADSFEEIAKKWVKDELDVNITDNFLDPDEMKKSVKKSVVSLEKKLLKLVDDFAKKNKL